MSDQTPEPEIPVRRVSFTVTGYLRHGHPVAGWFDMQAHADGGQAYSIKCRFCGSWHVGHRMRKGR